MLKNVYSCRCPLVSVACFARQTEAFEAGRGVAAAQLLAIGHHRCAMLIKFQGDAAILTTGDWVTPFRFHTTGIAQSTATPIPQKTVQTRAFVPLGIIVNLDAFRDRLADDSLLSWAIWFLILASRQV